jgi:hypothetical protein
MTDISFTDNLNDVIEGLAATGLPISDPVGDGSSLTGSAGDTLLTLGGGNLPAEGSATFQVPIFVPMDAPGGPHLNITSPVTGNLEEIPAESDGAEATLVVTIEPDFGDAPDSYLTRLGSGGASHLAVGPRLGALRDTEIDAAGPLDGTSDDLNDDDDEDGVTFTSILRQDSTATIDVVAPEGGHLDAFVDFDGNGSFADPGEKIFDGVPLMPGTVPLGFSIPPGAVLGDTYARFRISSAGGLGFAGPADDGEVEDYPITIGVDLTVTPVGGGLYQADAINVSPPGLTTFLYGTQLGSLFLPEYGLTIGVTDPVFFAEDVVDTGGQPSALANLPQVLDGQMVYFQAFEQVPNPEVSPLVTVTAVGPNDKIGVHRDDLFILDANGTSFWDGISPGADKIDQFGDVTGDTATIGDWNGDGVDDIGVFRHGEWYLDFNGDGVWNGVSGGDKIYVFGRATDEPIVGDWNGDGKDEIGVHRGDLFILDQNGDGMWSGTGPGEDEIHIFGRLTGDEAIIGDWNGDNVDDIGVVRNEDMSMPPLKLFILDANGTRFWEGTAPGQDEIHIFGRATDEPIIGDWNGDNKDDIGLHRDDLFILDANGTRFWEGTGPGQDEIHLFGIPSDKPISGNWSRTLPLIATTGSGQLAAAPGIEAADADAIVDAAVLLWESLLPGQTLPNVSISVADLPTGLLGTATGNSITLDVNANGVGWFVDETPLDHSEFVSGPGSPAEGRYDLLTAIAHEYGHVLGYDHVDGDDVMADQLEPGVRRLPGAGEVDDALLDTLASDVSSVWQN